MAERAEKNYYDILEVSPRAKVEVISASYTALRRFYAGDIQRVEELSKARKVLLDPTTRQEYDNQNRLEGMIVGNYRILELLREDDSVRTYKAEQVLAKETVTLKQCTGVSPEDDATLITEAKSVWNLRHYGLPIMRDLFRLDDGSLALVQSFIPGKSIEQEVKRLGSIDCESICWIADRVLNALRILHINNVVHSGLNPEIIIVEDEDHLASIVDFRFSVIDPLRNPGSKGAFAYFAAPEQLQDPSDPLKLPLLPQTDYYSLGKVMIYGLTGNLEMVEKNKLPDSTPKPLMEFIDSLTRVDVRERPNIEEDLLGLLEKVREKSFGRARSNMKALTSGS